MSYAQGIEVVMHPVSASGALATHVGPDTPLSATTVVAKWGPGYFTHQVHAVSIVMTNTAALANNTPIGVNHYRPWTGTNGATSVAVINLPTTLTMSGTGPVGVFHRVTANVLVRPGEMIGVQPTTAATNGVRGLCCLYVSPNYEQPTIGRTASTASTAGGGTIFVQTT